MSTQTSTLLTALLLTLSVPAMASKPTTVIPPLKMSSSDTPSTTASGHTFVLPSAWAQQRSGTAVILSPPEAGSTLALVDIQASDSDAALRAAWAAVGGPPRWPLKMVRERPAANGWEPSKAYDYDVPGSEQRTVTAKVLPYQGAWTVLLYDMANDVAEQRAAQIALAVNSLQPKGYQRESFAGKTAHKLDAARLAKLRSFIVDARQQLDIPGIAIGIVQDGKVVLAEGFGVRSLGSPQKVDADTGFMIASNTKALTTLLLAKLVDQGRFGWNTPVTRLLPTFKLGDAATTRKVQVKHLVCACTGLPRQDYEFDFEGETFTPATVLASLSTKQPTSEFGAMYQYSNTMAAAAGFVAGHALYPYKEYGAAYDLAMQSLVFAPLGMHATTFDFARGQRGNHAAPHAMRLDTRTVVADTGFNQTVIAARPAGGAWSTVNDLLRYVQMELAHGRLPNGQRYIGEAALLERRKPQVSMGADASYGMGLMVNTSTGTPVVHHGGDLSGYHSDMLWLPEHNVGAVILTNSNSGENLPAPFQRRLLEVLFDGRPEAEANLSKRVMQMRQELEEYRASLTLPADPATVSQLADRYRSPALGGLVVRRQGARIWFDFGAWRSEVASLRNEDGSVSFFTVSPGVAGYEFSPHQQGDARTLSIREAQHEYVFKASGNGTSVAGMEKPQR